MRERMSGSFRINHDRAGGRRIGLRVRARHMGDEQKNSTGEHGYP
jgi:hypothetical protein